MVLSLSRGITFTPSLNPLRLTSNGLKFLSSSRSAPLPSLDCLITLLLFPKIYKRMDFGSLKSVTTEIRTHNKCISLCMWTTTSLPLVELYLSRLPDNGKGLAYELWFKLHKEKKSLMLPRSQYNTCSTILNYEVRYRANYHCRYLGFNAH